LASTLINFEEAQRSKDAQGFVASRPSMLVFFVFASRPKNLARNLNVFVRVGLGGVGY
jgi:hypothetical protein